MCIRDRCAPLYICNAVAGYDGPTGIGSISGDVVAGAPGIGGPGLNGYLSSQTATSATLSAGIWPNDEATSYHVEYCLLYTSSVISGSLRNIFRYSLG